MENLGRGSVSGYGLRVTEQLGQEHGQAGPEGGQEHHGHIAENQQLHGGESSLK